jgi:quercetin dioxygenase-like cupin family protein
VTSRDQKTPGIAPGRVLDLARMVVLQPGAIVSKTLMNSPSGSLTLFAFDQGQQLSAHTAPFDAMVHIIEGTAEIVIDGTSTHVQQGEVILMPANVSHALNAEFAFKMLLTMFKSGRT